jgi:flagellar motility protein MotE (MotC chaperone)
MEIVSIYEKMEPDKAARIFENMEDRSMVVAILKSMSKEKATSILEEMHSDIVAEIIHNMFY